MLSDRKRQHNFNVLGTRVKEARTAQGFTQKALADALGLEYYTMVSQMELGYISIPPSLWTPIADKLRMDRAEWVLLCLLEVQPEVYSALFGNKPMAEVSQFLQRLDKGESDVRPVLEKVPSGRNPAYHEDDVPSRT